jgi:hypothetical protein
MNALVRLGASAIVALLVWSPATAQRPSSHNKLSDSVKATSQKYLLQGAKLAEAETRKYSQLRSLFAIDSTKKRRALSVSGLSVGSGMQRIGSNYSATYMLEGTVSVFNIPVDLSLNNAQSTHLLSSPFQNNLFKLGFDRNSLMKSMVPELDHYKELKEEVFKGKDASTLLRQKLMKSLKEKESQLQDRPERIYHYVNQYGSVEELLKLNGGELNAKLASLITAQKDSLQQVATQKKLQTKTQLDATEEMLLDSLVSSVQQMKGQLAERGIAPERIAAIERQVKENTAINSYVSANGLNSLKSDGWQGLLNRLYDVNVGSFGEQLPGSFMNKDLFLQGGAVSLKTRKGIVQIGLAASQDIGFSKDAGFAYSNFNSPKWLGFISIPVIGNNYAKSRISWTGSIEKQAYKLNESAGLSPRSGSALTLSQELGSEKMGRFTFELSKSAMAFRNVGQIGSEHILLEQNSFGNYFRDDFLETMAFGVKYDINNQKSRLNSNVFFNYSGIGFQSPAQQGVANMGLRMGGSLRKGFLKNKVIFSVRGDIKNTPVGGTSDGHWKNHNLNIDARFRLSRKFNFSVKYLDNGVSKTGEQLQSIYGSKKYQFDGSSSYKIFKTAAFSHVVVGLQDIVNPVAQSSSRFLTSIFTQSVSLEGVTLMGNLFFNKEIGKVNVLGDMINADANIQYSLLQGISLSTGGTYLFNKGQAKQLGVKQNMQFTAWKNFEVNLYADIRKNMFNPLYPELFANNRAEVSLKYFFR